MKKLMLLSVMLFACNKAKPTTRNHVCEVFLAQDADVRCTAQDTDVGELHSHSAIATFPTKSKWYMSKNVNGVTALLCLAGPCVDDAARARAASAQGSAPPPVVIPEPPRADAGVTPDAK